MVKEAKLPVEKLVRRFGRVVLLSENGKPFKFDLKVELRYVILKMQRITKRFLKVLANGSKDSNKELVRYIFCSVRTDSLRALLTG